MKDMMIGVDLAKNVFQIHGTLRTGEVQFRKKLTRMQFSAFMAQQKPCLVIFEACGSAHYWAHEMRAIGHEVKLIAPQYVTPFVKRQTIPPLPWLTFALTFSLGQRTIVEGSWLSRMLTRKPKMLVAIALANKMARQIWATLIKDEDYKDPALAVAA